MMKEVEKVLAYITRTKENREKLLVFEHQDFPEAGIQVPAGTVEANEPIEDAVVREIREESGLFLKGHCRFLGRFEWFREDRNELHYRNVFHVRYAETLKNEWLHEVLGHGEDRRMVFRFYWEDIKVAKTSLAADQGKYLHLL